MKRLFLWIIATGFVVIFGILLYGLIYALHPTGQGGSKTVMLKKGLTLTQIAQTLESEGIIHGVSRFVLLGRIFHEAPKIRAGEYEFELPAAPWMVLKKIIQGRVKTYKITIPEGYTLSQIGDILERNGIVTKGAFLAEAESAKILSHYHIQGNNPEGYLFPDTYTWSRDMAPSEVIQSLLVRFRQVFTPEMAAQASAMGLSELEAITIASVIEKETSDPGERYLVSAVIHNRLKKGIPLQSDPSVIYGIPDFNGNLTKADLKRYTPYNTYVIRGLPPGPISNPGLSSIMAALYPASVDYLYYVSKNNGTHHFSSSLEEHNTAVQKYQLHKGTPD